MICSQKLQALALQKPIKEILSKYFPSGNINQRIGIGVGMDIKRFGYYNDIFSGI